MSLIFFAPKGGVNPNSKKPMSKAERIRILNMSISTIMVFAVMLVMSLLLGWTAEIPQVGIDMLFWIKITSALGVSFSLILIVGVCLPVKYCLVCGNRIHIFNEDQVCEKSPMRPHIIAKGLPE